VDLPPEAAPVVDAHVAPPRPVEYGGELERRAVALTTDAVPLALLRFPLAVQTGYDVETRVMGVDRGNGALKKIKVDVTMKRLNAGPLLVGAMTTIVTHQDAQAASWQITFSFVGNDAAVSVTGAAGRNIDWFCTARIGRFSPAGL
jgi:hypothetical protein